MSENPTNNDNWQLSRKPNFIDVENLANELCTEYSNVEFFKWYCLVINILGLERVTIIRAMYTDHTDKKLAAKLFSARASQEAKAKAGVDRYQTLRSQYGKKY